ncbi:3-oxoacyl-ACP reductase family protein [Chloroflexus sp.]|uniref:SDR family NAD(P)-dependent oxidoreductase n=1 Tax=Chloroflexus sp. TaxID=1904827 RepID=UPI00298F382D|nr:3-oxoacyl-ACP reductase family protein [Chloroflexus sp.]MDW8403830.1 3-oxoacyl-ACP reductase family protein [Chloroflexus sp.]
MRLKDQIAIITGSGQGLGRAFALAFAREGAKVVIAERNAERGAAVASEIIAAGGEALVVVTDVSSESSTQAMAAATLERWGRIDVLLNNAAIFSTIKMRPFDQIPVQEWDDLMAVNVRGVWLCCKAVAPAMRQQRRGKIINIASVVFDLGRANYLHYVASKGAVIAITRGLATELGDYGINVNAISPSSIQTEIPRETVTREGAIAFAQQQVIKRVQEPADLIGPAIFLASSDSDFITGQTINVDGGLRFR